MNRPLSEGAFAELLEASRLIGAAERRIQTAQDVLTACRVPIDPAPFKRLSDCLDAAYAHLCGVTLSHLDAEAAAKQPQRAAS